MVDLLDATQPGADESALTTPKQKWDHIWDTFITAMKYKPEEVANLSARPKLPEPLQLLGEKIFQNTPARNEAIDVLTGWNLRTEEEKKQIRALAASDEQDLTKTFPLELTDEQRARILLGRIRDTVGQTQAADSPLKAIIGKTIEGVRAQ